MFLALFAAGLALVSFFEVGRAKKVFLRGTYFRLASMEDDAQVFFFLWQQPVGLVSKSSTARRQRKRGPKPRRVPYENESISVTP